MEAIDNLITKWESDYKTWESVLNRDRLFVTQEQLYRASQACLVIATILYDLRILKDKINKKQ